MGARDWAGLVKRALVPKTIDESGELDRRREFTVKSHGFISQYNIII